MAQVHPEPPAAVAKQVVRCAQPRSDVLVTVHARRLGNEDRDRQESGRSFLLLGKPAHGAIESHRGLDGQSVARPALLREHDADLVAPGHLPRDTRAGVLEQSIRVVSPVQVGCIQPLRWVRGVEVVVDVRAVHRAFAAMPTDEIPHTIAGDRPSDRPRDVVDLPERASPP
jgi:hypothetical protein